MILATPALVVFVVFMFVPLVLTFWYSLHSYRGFGAMKWVGFTNFTEIIHDPIFWSALLNTVLFTVISVPIGVVLGLGAAMLLDKLMPARGAFRALFYVPVVISGVAAGIIFLRLFDPLLGIVNQLLTAVHLPAVDWQGNGTAALISIIVVTTWQGVGFGMVVYLAGLQGIPRELHEAAAVDGATGWVQFRRITWPLLTEGSVRHTALALQAAAPPDAAPLRAVQPRAGRLGAADFSPGGTNFSRGGPVFSKSGEAKNCPLPDLMFRSFDDFLASLSQEKRKKIRQERRKVAEAGVTFRWSLGADISPSDWDFFYRCYERTYLEHGNAPYLSRKFFQRMADTMPQNWLLFVAEREGQPIAASLIAVSSSAANSIRTDSIPANATANHIITTNSIADYVYGTLAVGLNDLQLRPEPGISGNTTADEAIARDTRARDTPALHPTACEPSAPERTAYGRYWGALERVDCLHFEACYYQPLQWCIEHGYQRFEGGAQGEHKMARALMPVKTSSAHWLAQPAFADAVERFLAREGQGIESYMTDLSQRSPFRNPVPQG